MKLAMNKHGTHVLIKFIALTDANSIKEIFDIIVINFIHLAQNTNGLPVIKKTLAKFKSPHHKECLRSSVEPNAVELAQNEYGNYSL